MKNKKIQKKKNQKKITHVQNASYETPLTAA